MGNKIHKGKINRETSRTVSTDATAADELIALGQVEGMLIYEGNVWRPKVSEANTAQQNADLINAAITSSKSVKGTVIIPAGNFSTRTINFDPRVKLIGYGVDATILNSAAAEPLISYTDTTFQGDLFIKGMTLLGGVDENNRIGTTALIVGMTAQFSLIDLRIQFFTNIGIDLRGALIGRIENIFIRFCATGIKGVQGTSSIGVLKPNLVVFRSSSIGFCSDWGIDWVGGTSIHFDKGCNLEYNGTSGNANTGVIKFDSTGAFSSDQFGLTVEGSWFEQNNGTVFKITSHVSTALHRIVSCMVNSGTISNVIELNSGKLVVSECDFKSYSVNVLSGELETRNVTHGVVSLGATATHKRHDIKNYTGTVLNLGNVNGDNYNYTAASNATTYTTTNKVENAFASCLINSATEPTVTGATKIAGETFVVDTNMEMVVEVKNGAVRYFFLAI